MRRIQSAKRIYGNTWKYMVAAVAAPSAKVSRSNALRPSNADPVLRRAAHPA
jgi:hypothetical protein